MASKETSTKETSTKEHNQQTEENKTEERLFDPPLYKQRYHAVVKAINSTNTTRVLDIGCSEGQFLPVIKSMCPNVEEIYGIDVDKLLLERMKFRLEPLVIEYALKREKPLKMSFMHGSITEPDLTFYDIDFVSCIEVIEHLYEEDLKKVPHALFGLLRPKKVAITTPNREYNVLFKNFSGMRHWDHKFEWTRQEFETWCHDVMKNFPYSVEFSGVGEPPEEHSGIGCCSQMALFTRTVCVELETSMQKVCTKFELPTTKISTTNTDSETQQVCVESTCCTSNHSKYVTIHVVDYPYNNTDRETKISNEIQYLVNRFYSEESEDDIEQDDFVRIIPIKELLSFPGLSKLNVGLSEGINVIKSSDIYRIDEDNENLLVTFNRSSYERDWYEENDDDTYNNDVSSMSSSNIVQEEEDWGL